MFTNQRAVFGQVVGVNTDIVANKKVILSFVSLICTIFG